MKLVFAILFCALPLFAKNTKPALTIPLTVRVSGVFAIGDVEHEYSGTLNKLSSAADRTHFQGTAAFSGFGRSSLEKRMNFLTRKTRRGSYAEFAIFRGDTYHEFHFRLPALMPEAGIAVKGTVTTFRERPCTQVWETVCYEELGKGPADVTVSY